MSKRLLGRRVDIRGRKFGNKCRTRVIYKCLNFRFTKYRSRLITKTIRLKRRINGGMVCGDKTRERFQREIRELIFFLRH